MKQSFRLIHWASDQVNSKAWKDIMDESATASTAVILNPFTADDLQQYFFGDFGHLRFERDCSKKARKMGFKGFVDTIERSLIIPTSVR